MSDLHECAMQDEDGQVVGATVKDVLRNKSCDVYARQVSLPALMHAARKFPTCTCVLNN